ncbi:MAG: hypothetical protein AB8B84_11590 [Granulosicoccus sp.]
MSSDPTPIELLNHLCQHSRLSTEEAARLVREVLAFYNESVSEFIRRRHHELQKSGLSNAQIYIRIGEELSSNRFAATPMTERQIRRAIYG